MSSWHHERYPPPMDSADKPPSHRLERFIVRLPDGMRDQIAKAADANGRSMNAEIVHRLQRSFEPDEVEAEISRARREEMADMPDKAFAAFAAMKRLEANASAD